MGDLLRGTDPIVAFVGAGASALPPSCLPSWIAFNDLLLESLCERLGEFSRNRQPTDDMLAQFRTRRDQSRFLAPDFQAQLMEEEIGQEYFRVWQSLDQGEFGPVHDALAELATTGRIAAIITTNFDRLIERALAAKSHPFEVFHDADGYARLASRGDGNGATLPVVKIHGSIEDTSSLVDTLKQRVAGRPPALMQALDQLLRRHPWLFLGFSGADFGYDPHYLGVLGAADSARGFVFLARDGAAVQPGVQRLAEAYGPEKATIISGDLSTWLTDTFDIPRFASSNDTTSATRTADDRVRSGVQAWAAQLEPIAVVNILCAMLRASGMERQSHWLLRKTWKSYRHTADTIGKSYDRYNYNYGVALLEAGYISNPVALEDDMSNVIEWKTHADQNAFEFLARSYNSGQLLAGGAQAAAVLAYRGQVGEALALASKVTDEAIASPNKLDLCDVALACVPIYDMIRLFDGAAAQLHHCVSIARELGDEPRRAMLCAHLGRFLSYGGHTDVADSFLQDAEAVAERLDLQDVRLASLAARGRWLCDSGQSDEEAVRVLEQALAMVEAMDAEPLYTKVDLAEPDAQPTTARSRNPLQCRILLDLNRAARFAGDGANINRSLDQLDELATEGFPGYCPLYYLAYAQCLFQHGTEAQRPLLRDLLRRARDIGATSGNPWVAGEVDRFEAELAPGNDS